jgi:phage tail sheath protein FI
VYVEEVSFRAKSIEGVSTSTTAYVGPTRRGPVAGVPEVITSVGEFERVYGGLANLSFSPGSDGLADVVNYLAHGVRAFFENGGKRLYVARTFVPRTDSGGAIVSDGIATAAVLDSGGKRVEFVARAPGAGLNGRARVFLKKSRATAVTLKAAPAGSLVCTGGSAAAKPPLITGGAPPFSLNNGDQLGITVNGATTLITFNGSAAEVTGDALDNPLLLPADATLEVEVDKVLQRITVAAGSYTPDALGNYLNPRLKGAYVRLEGPDRLAFGTDRRGSGAEVTVRSSAAFGFSSAASGNGSGNVFDLSRVTAAEIDSLITAAGIAVHTSVPPSSGVLSLAGVATGTSSTLQVSDTPCRSALGLPLTVSTGQDGSNPLYFEKRGESWIGGGDGNTPLDTSAVTDAELLTITLEASDADGCAILYEDLGFGASHPRFVGAALPQTPARKADALVAPYWCRITGTVSVFELRAALFGSGSENTFTLANGNDGAEPVAVTTLAGAVSYASALEQLEKVEDISIIAAPGHSALGTTTFQAAQQALIGHAEKMRYRIAVLDTPPGQTISEARDTRSRVDSTRAALYYPWVVVANPLARPGDERVKGEVALPPSGFVTGIYARTDVERGVWKAPANEVVRGALRFEQELSHGQQEVLNPEGVNCLRFFSGRGNRVWGARTASSDPEWKYVNVRRYFIYLERSIDRSTQWAAFEPNNERLWANIRDAVSDFLYSEWRTGALLGDNPQEAYFVRCDRSTMTQNDLDNGRLVCEVGVAAVKPAEFVIFRIGQKTADARS